MLCLVSFVGGNEVSTSNVLFIVHVVQCEGEGEENLDKEEVSFGQSGTRMSHMLLNYSAESGEDADDEAGRYEDVSA